MVSLQEEMMGSLLNSYLICISWSTLGLEKQKSDLDHWNNELWLPPQNPRLESVYRSQTPWMNESFWVKNSHMPKIYTTNLPQGDCALGKEKNHFGGFLNTGFEMTETSGHSQLHCGPSNWVGGLEVRWSKEVWRSGFSLCTSHNEPSWSAKPPYHYFPILRMNNLNQHTQQLVESSLQEP